jgi:hypothetical protein
MKTNRITSIAVLVKGILMVLIGIIHTIAIYFELQDALKNMPENWAIQYALWFGITGMFWLFIGTIDLLSYSGLKRRSAHAWRTALCSSVFPVVFGPIGPILLWSSGPAIIFPMTILFLSIVGTAILVINHRKFTNSQT